MLPPVNRGDTVAILEPVLRARRLHALESTGSAWSRSVVGGDACTRQRAIGSSHAPRARTSNETGPEKRRARGRRAPVRGAEARGTTPDSRTRTVATRIGADRSRHAFDSGRQRSCPCCVPMFRVEVPSLNECGSGPFQVVSRFLRGVLDLQWRLVDARLALVSTDAQVTFQRCHERSTTSIGGLEPCVSLRVTTDAKGDARLAAQTGVFGRGLRGANAPSASRRVVAWCPRVSAACAACLVSHRTRFGATGLASLST